MEMRYFQKWCEHLHSLIDQQITVQNVETSALRNSYSVSSYTELYKLQFSQLEKRKGVSSRVAHVKSITQRLVWHAVVFQTITWNSDYRSLDIPRAFLDAGFAPLC